MLLSLFRSSAEKDHHMISILTKVEAVTRAEIDAIFVDSASHRFRVSQIALFHSREGHGNLSCCLPVENIEPSRKRTPPTPLKIFANLDHVLMVTQVLPSSKACLVALRSSPIPLFTIIATSASTGGL